MPAGRQWPALVLLAGLRAAEAFSTPSLARLPRATSARSLAARPPRATSARSLAARPPLRAPLQAKADGAAGDGKVLEFLEFVIGSTFKSPLYVGSADLHMAIPLPPPDTYPQWLPAFLKLPQAAYDYAERGVEEGWIKRAAADQVFEIKYGVLRGEVNVLPDSECEACELAKRKELEKSAASELVNIGEAERSRRSRTGYVIMASSIFAAYLAVDLDGGPWAGLWDVDGRGLVPIEDPILRQALRDKVNKFDLELARKTTPYLLLFTFFPFGVLKDLFF